MNRRTTRILILSLLLFGLLFALMVGARQARVGYVVRVTNNLPEDMVVYRRATDDRGRTWTVPLVTLERWWGRSRPIPLRRGDACELLFAPKWTVQRIARVELPTDALHATGKTDGSLQIVLRPDGPEVTALPDSGFSRLGWKLPLLYLAAVGWVITLARLRQRNSLRL